MAFTLRRWRVWPLLWICASAQAACVPVTTQVSLGTSAPAPTDLGTYAALSDTRATLSVRVQCERREDRFLVRLSPQNHLILRAPGGAELAARVPDGEWARVRTGSQVVTLPLLLPAGQWSVAGTYGAFLEVTIMNHTDDAPSDGAQP